MTHGTLSVGVTSHSMAFIRPAFWALDESFKLGCTFVWEVAGQDGLRKDASGGCLQMGGGLTYVNYIVYNWSAAIWALIPLFLYA